MKKEFESHIRKNFPNIFGTNLLIANSSGVDSMVLSTLLLQCNIPFAVAYANFQLRPAADQEEAFLREWARQNQLPFFTKKFDTATQAQKEKKSIQLMARELRYEWFETLQSDQGLDWVLTAHHLNDQVETFLMHSFRATGPQGLCGIPSLRGKVLRPLLPFTKEQILAFAQNEKIEWCEDSSNATDNYRRNRIRHQVIPALEEEFPQLYPNFQKTLQWMQQQQTFVAHQIELWKNKYWKVHEGNITIDLAALERHRTQDFWVHQLLAPFGFNAQEVVKLLHAPSGKHILSGTHRLSKERSHLTLMASDTAAEVSTFTLNSWADLKNSALPIRWNTKQPLEQKTNQIYLTPDAVQFPIVLRKKKVGDFIYPYGMKGRKKISKYFRDEKYTHLEKTGQWLLCQGSEVIWIVGRRANRKFVHPLESSGGVLLTFEA